MTPEQLAEKILQALAALADDGAITVEGGLPRELKVERPKNPEHGDYATNVAMQLGKRAGLNPRQFAELLAAKLRTDDAITAVEIAGPGFINLRVAADAHGIRSPTPSTGSSMRRTRATGHRARIASSNPGTYRAKHPSNTYAIVHPYSPGM